jgi:hypothetical protein
MRFKRAAVNIFTSLSSRQVVALRVELSATRLSAGFGQPALGYRSANVVVCQVGMAGLEPASPCSHDHAAHGARWVRRYPASRQSERPDLNRGHRPAQPVGRSWPPARRDTQASPRSVSSGSCGSRTRLAALKGRHPRTDRRTSHLERAPSTQWIHQVSAYVSRSGSGGARIRVCGFSGRRRPTFGRCPHLSYRPQQKNPMSL